MLFELRKKYNTLRSSEQKVADVLLEKNIPLKELTITRLAKAAGVSQPTVLRLAQALGLMGFKELKMSLVRTEGMDAANRNGRNPMYGHFISGNDRLEDIPAKTIYSTTKLLEETLQAISITEYKKAVQAIREAKQIMVCGVENSSATISDLVTKLVYLGLTCTAYSDYYLQSVSAKHLQKGDVTIGISYSGYSKDTVDTMRLAKEAGATTIAITNFNNACICKYADITIATGNQQLLCGDTIFSRTTQMAVNDMLYGGIMVSEFDKYEDKINKSSEVIADRAYRNVEKLQTK